MHGKTRLLILGSIAGLMLALLVERQTGGWPGSMTDESPAPDGQSAAAATATPKRSGPSRKPTNSLRRIEPEAPSRIPTDATGSPLLAAAPTDRTSAPSTRESPRAGWWLWPRIEPGPILPNQATVSIEGSDPQGPQTLELWRIGTEGPERVAQTQSTEEGRFDFGFMALPQSGLQLVVTPPSVDPASVSPLRLERLRPGPPDIRVEYLEDELHAWFTPARLEGEIWIVVENGSPIATQSISGGPANWTLEADELESPLWVTHITADGRSSQPVLFHRGHFIDREPPGTSDLQLAPTTLDLIRY